VQVGAHYGAQAQVERKECLVMKPQVLLSGLQTAQMQQCGHRHFQRIFLSQSVAGQSQIHLHTAE
jgi:hypothetical protein